MFSARQPEMRTSIVLVVCRYRVLSFPFTFASASPTLTHTYTYEVIRLNSPQWIASEFTMHAIRIRARGDEKLILEPNPIPSCLDAYTHMSARLQAAAFNDIFCELQYAALVWIPIELISPVYAEVMAGVFFSVTPQQIHQAHNFACALDKWQQQL